MHKLYQDWPELRAQYDLLKPPVIMGDSFEITGALPIIDGEGTLWDTFSVRIVIPSSYPHSLPTITEVERRIRRSEIWHINDDGTCCVGTTAEQYRKLHGRFTLLNWVNEFAVPFFANYIYRKDKGAYYNGEWSHGTKGIYEDYAQLYEITDLRTLIQTLEYCSDRITMSRNLPCFCNSGKKYKRCYLLKPELHRNFIPKQVIWNDIVSLKRLKNALR